MRLTALALIALGAFILGGCQASQGSSLARTLPQLPDNPEECTKYCKVWVPAKKRMVPKLVQTCCATTKNESITVMETRAREVMVKGPVERKVDPCCKSCTDTLVQVKPGGRRWECDGDCWQYCYRPPEYKWCTKTVQENKIRYCYNTPAEYKTVVETRAVCKPRSTYVPPKYEVKYVEEVYEPGHYVWRKGKNCNLPKDTRTWSGKHVYKSDCSSCPKPVALDCGCPRSN